MRPWISIIWVLVLLAVGCTSVRTTPRRTCATCGTPITGEFVEVGEDTFHPEHFTCAYCNKPIEEGTYIPDHGKNYHTSCYAGRVIVCAYCGEATEENTFVTYQGRSYHSSCLREHVVTCAYCGKVTDEDAFVEYEGKSYHRSCFRTSVVPCAFCGDPIRDGTYTSVDGKSYHRFCYEEFVALRCALCGEKIDGDYLTDYWGGKYHPSHAADSPQCAFCGVFLKMPLDRGSVRYDDGRCLCGSCRKSAVTAVKDVVALASEVSGRLRAIGIDVDARALSFRVTGAKEMRRLGTYRQHKVVGLTTYNEVPGVPGRTTSDQITVYVLYGMPRVQAIATLSHELTHVWQLLHAELKIDRTLAEGSCEYAAYRVLEDIPGAQSQYLIDTMTQGDDPVYGDAFRRVKRYADDNGMSRWLILLETNGSLPAY